MLACLTYVQWNTKEFVQRVNINICSVEQKSEKCRCRPRQTVPRREREALGRVRPR